MNYIRIELAVGTPLDAFYPRMGTNLTTDEAEIEKKAIEDFKKSQKVQ